MNPNIVFSASLVTSLVLWYPSMQACLRGDLELAPAGLRYLAALAVSRLALGFLARLVSAYQAAQHPDAPGAPTASAGSPAAASTATSPSAAADPGSAHRRRTDRSGEDDTDPASLAA
jgi:hypothetical protein